MQVVISEGYLSGKMSLKICRQTISLHQSFVAVVVSCRIYFIC